MPSRVVTAARKNQIVRCFANPIARLRECVRRVDIEKEVASSFQSSRHSPGYAPQIRFARNMVQSVEFTDDQIHLGGEAKRPHIREDYMECGARSPRLLAGNPAHHWRLIDRTHPYATARKFQRSRTRSAAQIADRAGLRKDFSQNLLADSAPSFRFAAKGLVVVRSQSGVSRFARLLGQGDLQ